MVSKTTATVTHNTANKQEERPLFIPPRKRQASKKTNGAQNYVDHIVNVQQNRQKLSPSNVGSVDDDLLKTSLKIKNKQPLPALPNSTTHCSSSADTAAVAHTPHTSHHHQQQQQQQQQQQHIDRTSATSVDSITFPDDNELQTLGSRSASQRHESSTVTPSSYSESSLDVKLSNNCLSHRSSSKKRVNIRTAADLLAERSQRNSPDIIANYEDLESGETSVALNAADDEQHSLERYHTRRAYNGDAHSKYLTMTGTIKRGRKKGQCMDLQINMSREELERINAHAVAALQAQKRQKLCCQCTLTAGVHVLLLSLLCLPFVVLVSAIYSFYIGTLTWYNMFNFFNEEKSCVYRFLMSPILILIYPIAIVLCSLGLGLFAGIVQLSLQFNTWLNEIADIEKGFYGWLCSFLHLSDCSPYEVVILTDICLPHDEPPRLHVHTSIEELSL